MSPLKPVFKAKMQLEFQEFAVPDTLADDQILVQNRLSLISPGTELALFTAKHIDIDNPANKWAKYPFFPGYSEVGTAVKVGAKVTRIRPGQTVYHLHSHSPWSVVSEADAVQTLVTRDLTDTQIVFLMFLGISWTAVAHAGNLSGQRVAIIGMGLIGNICGQLMKAAYDCEVIAIDLVPERLKLAQQVGLDHTINPAETDPVAGVKALCGGRPIDCVVEAVGATKSILSALKIAGDGSKVILLGSPREVCPIDVYHDIHVKGVHLIGAHGRTVPQTPELLDRFQRFLSTGKVRIEALITETVKLADLGKAYDKLRTKPSENLGILVDPR
ncbi:MAG: zinc-dependent alcohol dehydrogenase [Planctomycetota bacterium]